MAKDKNSPREPLGDSIRKLINPALEDARRMKIQLDILDRSFTQVAEQFTRILESKYRAAFNAAAEKEAQEKNPFLIRSLTSEDSSEDSSPYSPVIRLSLPVSVAFTQFSADDVKSLPGYIKLHEAARAENVALRIIGLTADEARNPSGFSLPPILIIDGSKAYEDGALENSNLYPDLPPPKPETERDKPQSFDI